MHGSCAVLGLSWLKGAACWKGEREEGGRETV